MKNFFIDYDKIRKRIRIKYIDFDRRAVVLMRTIPITKKGRIRLIGQYPISFDSFIKKYGDHIVTITDDFHGIEKTLKAKDLFELPESKLIKWKD